MAPQRRSLEQTGLDGGVEHADPMTLAPYLIVSGESLPYGSIDCCRDSVSCKMMHHFGAEE
jgi:hypothetical protein